MACKSQIIREVRKERGSRKRLLRYYEASCLVNGCLNITLRDVYSFHKWSGYCKKCSDLKKINGIDRLKHTTAKEPYLALFNSLLKTCKEKNKTISLTFEEFKTFTNESKCYYCFEPIKWAKHNLLKNGSRYNLDRIDNNKGYILSNLVVCCWRCNNSKGNRYSFAEWFGMTKFFRDKKEADLTRVIEMSDNTDLSGELACTNGVCEIV